MATDLKSFASDLQGETPLTMDYETHKRLDTMSHSDLMELRNHIPADNQQTQNLVAPYEHQAFAREYVNENPIRGTIALAGEIPAYYLAKMTGLASGRSQPSLQEMAAGYNGIGQGLMQHFTGNF